MEYCEFSFTNRDSSTKEPLPGSIFQLSSGGIPLSLATADVKGTVDFGLLAAGDYELTEISVPSGYLPNTTAYTVTVANETILVGGAELLDFSPETNPHKQSPPPAMDSLYAESLMVSGNGISGCIISVTLPDGTILETEADLLGNWQVAIPEGIRLQSGEVVTAQQTGALQLTSKPASQTVWPVTLCTFTYDANGGLGEHPESLCEADFGSAVTEDISGIFHFIKAPEEIGISRETFFFAAWNTAADGSGDYFFPGEKLNVSDSITLYAQWIYAGPYHIVCYCANGGSGGLTVPDGPEGSRCTIATAEDAQIAFPGCSFSSWNTRADGSGRMYLPGDTLVLIEDLTLYAQWQVNPANRSDR